MDLAAFERLYRRYSPDVYSLAYRITGSREDAGDITQETFWALWKHRKRIRNTDSVRSWLLKVAANRSVSLLRKRKRTVLFEAQDPPEDATIHPGPGPYLERALLALPAGQRAVFLLHEVEGFTHDEIAQILGISTGTCKSQLHKAKRKLRAMLQGVIER